MEYPLNLVEHVCCGLMVVVGNPNFKIAAAVLAVNNVDVVDELLRNAILGKQN